LQPSALHRPRWDYYDAGGSINAWDMAFNTKYTWSINESVTDPDVNQGDGSAMDFLEIATHEAGNAAGMGHTDKTSVCAPETMYPTASYGETQKRTLELGDSTGIYALYHEPRSDTSAMDTGR
jgi:hypothetical protein